MEFEDDKNRVIARQGPEASSADPSNAGTQRDAADAEEWSCVRIAQVRLVRALDTTFRNLLMDEYVEAGCPADCQVYLHIDPTGDYIYFFSPGATALFTLFLKFWQGAPSSEPRDLLHMDIVI